MGGTRTPDLTIMSRLLMPSQLKALKPLEGFEPPTIELFSAVSTLYALTTELQGQ